jgi:regulator of RNase E activity RraA
MDTREKLLSVSTATLTTQLFKRGFRNVFIHGLRALNPRRDRLCGPAYTLRYIPAREDLDHIGVFEDRSHPQRVAIEQCPAGAVLVVDSRGDALAASAGGILMARLMVRGAAGFVTDGGLRDTGEIAALDFPSYCRAASAPTNLIRHHAVGLNEPIGCGGVAVYPGDMVVGDGDGVVVIPAHLAAEIADACYEQEKFEEFVVAKVKEGRSIFGLYPPDDATKAEYKKQQR